MSQAESFRLSTKDTHRVGIDLLGDSSNRIEVLIDAATKEAIMQAIKDNRSMVIITRLNDDKPDADGATYETIEAMLPISLN